MLVIGAARQDFVSFGVTYFLPDKIAEQGNPLEDAIETSQTSKTD